MAKSDLTPTKVEFIATVMNIKAPSRRILQKKYNQALGVAEPQAELALSDNREKVYNALQIKVELDGVVPEIEASTDAQYSNRGLYSYALAFWFQKANCMGFSLQTLEIVCPEDEKCYQLN